METKVVGRENATCPINACIFT